MSEKRISTFSEIITVLVLVLILISLSGIKAVYAQTGQVTLKPTDNTSAPSANPNLNVGGLESLGVGNGTIGSPPLEHSTEELAWLKFNLSSVPNGAVVDTATLQLYAFAIDGTNNVNAYSCANNEWTELTLTYSNMPSYNTTSMDTVSVQTSNQWYNWSVVYAVTNALSNNSESVTIVLGEPMLNNTISDVTFDSKEFPTTYGDYSPRLTVHWSGVVSEFQALLFLPLFMIAMLITVIFYKAKFSKRLYSS